MTLPPLPAGFRAIGAGAIAAPPPLPSGFRPVESGAHAFVPPKVDDPENITPEQLAEIASQMPEADREPTTQPDAGYLGDTQLEAIQQETPRLPEPEIEDIGPVLKRAGQQFVNKVFKRSPEFVAYAAMEQGFDYEQAGKMAEAWKKDPQVFKVEDAKTLADKVADITGMGAEDVAELLVLNAFVPGAGLAKAGGKVGALVKMARGAGLFGTQTALHGENPAVATGMGGAFGAIEAIPGASVPARIGKTILEGAVMEEGTRLEGGSLEDRIIAALTPLGFKVAGKGVKVIGSYLKGEAAPEIEAALAKEKPSRADAETVGIEGKPTAPERAEAFATIRDMRAKEAEAKPTESVIDEPAIPKQPEPTFTPESFTDPAKAQAAMEAEGATAVEQPAPVDPRTRAKELGLKIGGLTDEAVARKVAEAEAKAETTKTPEEPHETPTKPPQEAAQPGERPEGATSARRAWMDEDAALLGLDEVETPARRSWQTALEQAKQRNVPEQAGQLAAEVKAKPRAFDDVETAGMVIRAAELKKAHADAMKRVEAAAAAKDSAALQTAAAEGSRIEQEFESIYQALRASGTEKGRNLAAQKLTIDENYDLLSVVNRARAARGGELPPGVRSELETLVKQHSETIEKLKVENEKLQQALSKRKTATKASEPELLKWLTPKADEARVRVKEKLLSLHAGIDPTLLGDLAIIGAEKIARGAVSAAKFAKAMSEEFGESWKKIKVHASEIHKAAQEMHRRGSGEFLKTQRTKLSESRKQTAEEGVKSAVDRGSGLDEMGRSINRLAEEFVRGGVTDREKLIDAVHAVLKPHFPDLTRRQTMDAISGYGDYSLLSKDPVKAKLRDLKGQMQQVGKLEDMKAGKAPAKTGMERRTPSDEERGLIKQVNEKKKEGGYTVTDPERQLRTTLQASKTRLKNEISDLEKQIKTHERIVKKKGASPTDAELEALKARRGELKKQFDDIFGRRELTDAQRVDMAILATRKSIADLEQRIANRDVNPRKGLKRLETPELNKLRAQREALSQTLQRMREAAGVYDDARIARSLEQTQKQVDELTGHIQRGTLPKAKPVKVAKTSPELEAVRAQRDALKKQLASSEPAVQQRLEQQIADLDARLAGPIEAPTPKEIKRQSAVVERLQFEVDKRRMEIRRRIQAQKPKSILSQAAEPMGIPRLVMASSDVSAVGRQGGFITKSHPIMAAKNLRPMFESFGTEQGAWRAMRGIESRPKAPRYARSGLRIAEMDGPITAQEEAFSNRLVSWAQRSLPGKIITWPIRGSQRAYTVFLNLARADYFDLLTDTLAKKGEATAYEDKVIANFVNVASGYGKLPKSMETGAQLLNDTFFAPRYVMSRFQLLTLQPLWHGTMRTRKLIAMEYARYLIGVGAIYGLAALVGGKSSFDDPTSSDFGKIRFGDTRLDVLSGLSQTAVFMSRFGKSVSDTIRGRRDKTNDLLGTSTVGRFLRSKLAPVPSTIVDLDRGTDYVGNKVTLGSEAKEAIIPLSMRDIYDVMKEQGVPGGTALWLLSLFGEGLQTYEKKQPKKKGTKGLSSRGR